MELARQDFLQQINSGIRDTALQRQWQPASEAFLRKQKHAISQFKDIETVRQRAAARRWKVTENLDKYLIEFESNFARSGGKLLWARDAAEAQSEISAVLKNSFARELYYAGDSLCDEIKLKESISDNDIKIIDLEQSDALTSVVVVEANYFVADPGAIVIIDYEGFMQKALSHARCIIAVAAIDDVLHHLSDLNLFIPLTSSYTRGETINPFTSLLFGPRQPDEPDGPSEIYLAIIDNGRSSLLADEQARETLWCIKCGACCYVCPVTATIGTKKEVYDGPVAALQVPHLKDFEDYQYLSRATTLCGACTDICPVHINLHELFPYNRKKENALQLNLQKEKWMYLLWKKAMLKRSKFGFAGFKANRIAMQTVYEKVWGTTDSMPPFAKKSFNDLWKEKINE